MMKRLSFFVLFILTLTGLMSRIGRAADIKSLVEAERAFARLSEVQGIREAFLANLADDAIVFRPRPVPGKKLYAERDKIPGWLTWSPEFAAISRAGDLGYTSGPYELRDQKKSDPVSSSGHYITLWRVQPDGSWKAVFDGGVVHPAEGKAVPDLIFDTNTAAPAPPSAVDVEKERAALLAWDRQLSEASAGGRYLRNILGAMAEDVRLYRPASPPFLGKDAAAKALSKTSGDLSWEPMAAHVSSSGDLGYTYGIAKTENQTPGGRNVAISSYMRIWIKRGAGDWKIILDLAVDVPPSP
jgi:ketosteroid isomerase-like protein